MNSRIVCCTTLFLSVSIIAGAAVIFQDNFENITPGNPPSPTVGTYSQLVGNNLVIDNGGSQVLRSIDAADNEAFLVNCLPTNESSWAIIQYTLRINGDNLDLVGINAFNQQLVLRPLGDNLMLNWSADGKTYLNASIGSTMQEAVDLEFDWLPDTDYTVLWRLDAATDTYALQINGTIVRNATVFGDDLTGFYSLAIGSNSLTIGEQTLDNIIIEGVVPEPTSLLLLAAGGVALLRKRK